MQWFVACLHLAPEVWTNDSSRKNLLTILETSPHFIHSHVRRWSGQRLLATLWERGDVRDYDVHIQDRNFPLSEEQIDICNALTDVLVIRDGAVGNGNGDVHGGLYVDKRACGNRKC